MSNIANKYEKAVEKFNKKWLFWETQDLDMHLLLFLKPRIKKLIELREWYESNEENDKVQNDLKELYDIIDLLEYYIITSNVASKEYIDRMFDLLKENFRALWY